LRTVGLSGGVLVGCDSSKFIIEQYFIGTFSITLMLKNRTDNFKWTFTTFYGPIDSSLKDQFWTDLRQIYSYSYEVWLLCRDFNSIRFRNEKSGINFPVKASAQFNALLEVLNLIERKYTWSNGRQSALLDRFLCSIHWDNSFSQCRVIDLPKYVFDYCPLLLHTSMATLSSSNIFRFDKIWLKDPEFNKLVLKWWTDFKLKGDIDNSWHEKLKYIKRKMKGWHKNLLAKKERKTNSFEHFAFIEKN
jgi:hypothetical protein